MRDFRRLAVWQKAHALALRTYGLTASFPAAERFSLTSQMRRAGSSIPSNLAEGCGRTSEREFANFVNIAFGSASELEYFALLARDLTYVKDEIHAEFETAITEVKRMHSGLLARLRESSQSPKLKADR
jgi:four helix bundle protein